MPAPKNPFEKQYKAFISYSHADNRKAGRKWADWLHHALETYQVPAELAGRPNAHGGTIPERIYPVFQDEKELSANADLNASLNSALDRSEFLVYLSSPRAARSPYVQEEIRHFKRTGRSTRIIALIVRGEPEYGDTQTENQCFPEVLRFAVLENGETDFSRHHEALAADARLPDGSEGFTGEAAYRDFLQRGGMPARQARQKAAEYAERLNLAKLKIISAILGVPLAELTRRDQAYQLEQVKRKNRAIKRVAAVVAFLAVVAAGAGIYAWQQKNAAQHHLAQSLLASGISKLAQDEYGEPAAYIAAAVRAGSSHAARLAESLLAARAHRVLLPDMNAASSAFSPDGRYIAGFASKGNNRFALQIWDTSGRRLAEEVAQLPDPVPGKPLFDRENRIYVRNGAGDILRYNPADKRLDTVRRGSYRPLAVSADGRFLALRDDTAQTLHLFDTADDNHPEIAQIPVSALHMGGAAFSDDSGQALLWADTADSRLVGRILNLHDRTAVPFDIAATLPQQPRFAADRRHILFLDGGKALLLDSARGRAQTLGNADHPYRWADFNPDGDTLIAVHPQGYDVYRRDGSLKTAQTLPLAGLSAALGDNGEYAPDRTRHLLTANKQLYLADTRADNLLISEIPYPPDTRLILADRGGQYFLALSADGTSIARTHAETREHQEHFITLPQSAAYFRIIGDTYLMAADAGRTLYFFRADDGRAVGEPIPTRPLGNILFNHDGSRFLVRTGEDSFAIHNIGVRTPVFQYRHPQVLEKFTTDDHFQYLLAGSAGHWQLRRIADGRILLSGAEGVNAAAFSADSRLLAVAGTGGQADVYDLHTLRKTFSLPTISTPLLGFSPDGKTLLASHDTKHLRLWDTRTGRTYGQILPVVTNPELLEFSADSRYLFLQDYAGGGITPAVKIIGSAGGNPVSLPFAQGVYLNMQLVGGGRRLAAAEYLQEGNTARLWQIPHHHALPPEELAAGLEAYYGRKYNPQTGAVETHSAPYAFDTWYFADTYTRPVAPGARTTVPEPIARLLPAQTPAHIRQLAATHFYHPLAKAGLAQYFNRRPDTRALGAWLAQLAERQLPHIADPALRERIRSLLAPEP